MMDTMFLRGTDTFTRKTTLSILFFLPSEKGSTLKEKTLLPVGRTLFNRSNTGLFT